MFACIGSRDDGLPCPTCSVEGRRKDKWRVGGKEEGIGGKNNMYVEKRREGGMM